MRFVDEPDAISPVYDFDESGRCTSIGQLTCAAVSIETGAVRWARRVLRTSESSQRERAATESFDNAGISVRRARSVMSLCWAATPWAVVEAHANTITTVRACLRIAETRCEAHWAVSEMVMARFVAKGPAPRRFRAHPATHCATPSLPDRLLRSVYRSCTKKVMIIEMTIVADRKPNVPSTATESPRTHPRRATWTTPTAPPHDIAMRNNVHAIQCGSAIG